MFFCPGFLKSLRQWVSLQMAKTNLGLKFERLLKQLPAAVWTFESVVSNYFRDLEMCALLIEKAYYLTLWCTFGKKISDTFWTLVLQSSPGLLRIYSVLNFKWTSSIKAWRTKICITTSSVVKHSKASVSVFRNWPCVDSRVFLATHHRVCLSWAGLSIGQNANIISIHTRSYHW